MTAYLLDTNVVSEFRKGQRANPNVRDWMQAVANEPVYLSPLVFGEIRQGIERARRTDPLQAAAIERWLLLLEREYEDRTLPITTEIAEAWGRLNAPQPRPIIDSLMAATALVHGLTFVTRNARDVAGTGVDVLDPFED